MGSKDEGRDETEGVAVPGQDPRVGDTWESMDPRDEEHSGPRRRVGVLEVDGDQVHVENKVTRRKSHVALDRFAPPYWRFVG